MAQRSHVPKFGNWEGNNTAYTAYFENARKDRGSGKQMINPNDPEQNPDAFMAPRTNQVDEPRDKIVDPNNYDYHNVRKPPPPQSRNRMSTVQESISDMSSSDYPRKQPGHQRRSSKSSSDGGYSYSPSPQPSYSTSRTVNARQAENHHRPASVPKFGSWDDTDPASGDGFTVIFNKVKEDKQNNVINPVMVSDEPKFYPNNHRKNNSTSSRLKMCFCFPS